jgi:hypothetical protein
MTRSRGGSLGKEIDAGKSGTRLHGEYLPVRLQDCVLMPGDPAGRVAGDPVMRRMPRAKVCYIGLNEAER